MAEPKPVYVRWITSSLACSVHGSLHVDGDRGHDPKRVSQSNVGDNVLEITTPDGLTTLHCGICWADWYRATFPPLTDH